MFEHLNNFIWSPVGIATIVLIVIYLLFFQKKHFFNTVLGVIVIVGVFLFVLFVQLEGIVMLLIVSIFVLIKRFLFKSKTETNIVC